MSTNVFPPGSFVKAVTESCKSLRTRSRIQIDRDAIVKLIHSPAFTGSFAIVSKAHGLAFPLNFPSVVAELNLLAILSLLNFGSGYRVPLHEQTGRGAWDNMRALVFSLYLTSSSEGDMLSAKGIRAIGWQKIAELMRVDVYVERKHESIPAVMVGELTGPMYELVRLITSTLNETGEVLERLGYPDLGSFVLEALRNGEKAGGGKGVEIDVVLQQIVRALPAFQDMTFIDGEPVYVFKKALFLIHAISIRFKDGRGKSIPVPDSASLPVFSDNVLPSLLIHLGIIKTQATSLSLPSSFTEGNDLDLFLEAVKPVETQEVAARMPKEPPKGGPELTERDAYILRAAAVDACEMIVEVLQSVSDDTQGSQWMRGVTTTDLDMWLWAVAKERKDYRKLQRFVLRNTVMF